MEKTTFTDAKVTELLQRCILVRIDVDQYEELAQRLGVIGLPDLRFVTPDGKVVLQLRGYQFPDDLATALASLVHSVEH